MSCNKQMRKLWLGFIAGIFIMPLLAWAQTPILIVGDSLSAAHNIPVQAGWVSLLEQRLKQQTTPAVMVVNASISGETSAGALTRLPALLTKHQPRVVVIELGGNDALRGLSLPRLRSNLQQMIELSQQVDAKVLLLGIDVPPNYGPTYRRELRAMYADLAQTNETGIVPFLLEGVVLQPGWMQADGIHPTEAGQPQVLENVWPQLQSLLSF